MRYFPVYEAARGVDDEQILQKAFSEQWIIITSDKDFGEKIYREQWPHPGCGVAATGPMNGR